MIPNDTLLTRNDTHQLPPFYPKSNVQVEALCSLLKAGSWETAGTWGVPSRIKAWIPKSNPNTTITSCNVPTRTTYKLNWWIHYLWSGKLPRCVPFCTLSVSSARDWAARSSHLQSLLIHWISVNSVLRWGGYITSFKGWLAPTSFISLTIKALGHELLQPRDCTAKT